jgi:hypothetical protein
VLIVLGGVTGMWVTAVSWLTDLAAYAWSVIAAGLQ